MSTGFDFFLEVFENLLSVFGDPSFHFEFHSPLLLHKLFLINLLDFLGNFGLDFSIFDDVVKHFFTNPVFNLLLSVLSDFGLKSLRELVTLLGPELLEAL